MAWMAACALAGLSNDTNPATLKQQLNVSYVPQMCVQLTYQNIYFDLWLGQ